MTWVTAVLISTTVFAVVAVLDKRLTTNLFPSAGSFNVGFGVMQVCVSLIYFAFVIPSIGFDGGSGIPWAMASGLFWGLGLFFFFHGLRLEEVSRAVPVQQMGPVFAAVVAVLFLGESLTAFQWAAALLVIGGAVLVSARPEHGLFRIARGRAFFLLLAGSFSMGMAFVVSEQATREMNVWAIQAVRSGTMSVSIFLLSARPVTVRQFLSASRNPYNLWDAGAGGRAAGARGGAGVHRRAGPGAGVVGERGVGGASAAHTHARRGTEHALLEPVE